MSAFPPDLFAGERFAVLGLGRNGLPAARALAAMGAEVTAWDDQPAARAQAAGLRVAEPCVGAIDALVLSPGIAHTFPAPHPVAAAAREAGVPILSDAELLFRAVRRAGSTARFAGITGTNGKSTTTALLAHILAAAGVPVAAGGNLGAASLSLPLLPPDAVYVLEMSSYMLERLATLRFDVAAMLNLSPDHLDRHGDMDGYIAAKREIFARQTGADLAVAGVDDDPSRRMVAWLRRRPVKLVTVSADDVPPGRFANLPGRHNRQNIACALAMARALGCDADAAAQAVAGFPGLPHRMQTVGQVGGIAFVDDSKATNALSAAAALDAYPQVVWIAGGIAKAGGIESLRPLFPRVAHAVLIGRDAERFAQTLADVPHEIAGTLEQAVPAAFSHARRAGVPVVLLSPACASFDQFASFEARGQAFRSLVAGLAGGA